MKRSISISGHMTSIFLEDAFWQSLSDIAKEQNCSRSALIRKIDKEREAGEKLSSRLRIFVLAHYRDRVL
ncbi:MAG: ribbon-helix-helix domain-containing protein [Parvibaculales bacterium]